MKKHLILKKFISGISKGYGTSLIVVSPAGYGKTETTIEAMKEMNFVEGRDYIYTSNYITPLELYKLLEKVNRLKEPRILILDDCEETLRNKRAIGLLRSALWETPLGKRKVFWISGTHRIKHTEFDFIGRVIILLNEMKTKSPIVNALKDRSFFYEIKMDKQEILGLIEQRAEIPYHQIPEKKRKEIASFIRKVGYNSENLTLRLLPKVYQLYLISPNHWQELSLKIL